MPGKTKIVVDRIHQSSILDHMYPGNAPNQQPQGYSQAPQMPPGYPMMPPVYPMMGPHGYPMMQQYPMMAPHGFPMMPPQGYPMMGPHGYQMMPPQDAPPAQGSVHQPNVSQAESDMMSRHQYFNPGVPRPIYQDDARKLSTTYKALGIPHVHGVKRVTTKKFRSTLINACNSDEFSMVKLSQLSEEETDVLLYILTGVLPDTKVTDLGAVTKGDARDGMRKIYLSKLKRNLSRLNVLSEELDNILGVGLRLGYPVDLLTPETAKMYCAMKSRYDMLRSGDIQPESAPTLGGMKRPLAIENPDGPKAIADGVAEQTSDSG